jgi:hypothetical protein
MGTTRSDRHRLSAHVLAQVTGGGDAAAFIRTGVGVLAQGVE